MTREASGDGLIPAVNQAGRDESYWTARNALVTAVRAVDPSPTIGSDRLHVAARDRTAEEQAAWDRYGVELDRLKAFDAEHVGAPVL